MAFGKPQTPLTPEEQIERNRRRAIGLSVAAEAFKGGDPVSRGLALRQQFEEQEEEIKTQEQQEEQNKLLDEAIKQ